MAFRDNTEIRIQRLYPKVVQQQYSSTLPLNALKIVSAQKEIIVIASVGPIRVSPILACPDWLGDMWEGLASTVAMLVERKDWLGHIGYTGSQNQPAMR